MGIWIILTLITLVSVQEVSSFYDDCRSGGVNDTVLCIGATNNVPSVLGSGGCMDSQTCEVALLVSRQAGGRHRFWLAVPRNDDLSLMIRATVELNNRKPSFFMMKEFPSNLLYIEGRTPAPGKLENIVWIKYSNMPTPACLNALDVCSDQTLAQVFTGHFIPQPISAEADSDNMLLFPFETASDVIFFKNPEKYSTLDGVGYDANLNIHLDTELIVLSLHHIASSWITSGSGVSYPSDDAELINLIETKPFHLFHETPSFLTGRAPQSMDLTWVWILIAIIVIIILLCLLFWFLRRKRDLDDGHVDVRGSSNSRPASDLRSGVPSRPLSSTKANSFGRPDARSAMANSSHEPAKSHTFTSATSSPKSSSPFPARSLSPASTNSFSSSPSSAASSPASFNQSSSRKPLSTASPKSSSASHKSGSKKKLDAGLSSI